MSQNATDAGSIKGSTCQRPLLFGEPSQQGAPHGSCSLGTCACIQLAPVQQDQKQPAAHATMLVLLPATCAPCTALLLILCVDTGDWAVHTK